VRAWVSGGLEVGWGWVGRVRVRACPRACVFARARARACPHLCPCTCVSVRVWLSASAGACALLMLCICPRTGCMWIYVCARMYPCLLMRMHVRMRLGVHTRVRTCVLPYVQVCIRIRYMQICLQLCSCVRAPSSASVRAVVRVCVSDSVCDVRHRDMLKSQPKYSSD
jgi:hypothetical protein